MSVIGMVDCRVSDAAIAAAGIISNTITPIAAACFGIYMILMMVNYMRGGSSSPVWDVFMRAAGFAVIIGLGLKFDSYAANVVPMVQGIGDDLANAVSGSSVGANSLDTLALHYINIIQDGYTKLSKMGLIKDGLGAIFIAGLLFWFKTIVILLGLVPFLVLAAALLIVAKVGTALIVAVGPIFFACLIFPATRQYFSAWVNSAVSYALIPIFVAIIAMVSVNISMEIFNPSRGFLAMSFVEVFMAAIVNLLLILLLKTCSALASSLSAGGINVGSPANAATMQAGRGALRGAGTAAGKGVDAVKSGGKWLGAEIQRLRGNSLSPGKKAG